MKKKLFVIPHFSDIVVSCAGLVSLNLESSLVVNVFTAKPGLIKKFTKRSFSQEFERESEKRLRKMLGFQYLELGFPDSYVRGRNPETYFSTNLTVKEEDILMKLQEKLNSIIIDNNITEIYSPLALRNHIDHYIVREAVKKIPGDFQIFYYDDNPDFNPDSPDLSYDPNLEKIVLDISSVLDKKINAIKLYKATLRALYQSEKKVIESITKHPVELYWKVID